MYEEESRALREPEEKLSADVMHLVEERERADLVHVIFATRNALESLALSAHNYPSLLDSQTLGERERNIDTLLNELSQQTSFTMELAIPTRAAVAHALGLGRLNYFRMLKRVLEQLPADGARRAELTQSADGAVADCIAMRAAEEVLRAILGRPENGPVLRHRAALILLHIWHNIAAVDLGEMLPVLSATWRARRKVHVTFGTMLGASELFSLLTEGCDPRFVEFLTRDECSKDEIMAFHEFLFGLSTEEMRDIQAGFSQEIVTPSLLFEKGVITTQQINGICQAGDEAEHFFHFFMKRHLLATYRHQMGLIGPKKTAEQYVLSHLLVDHWDSINVW